MKKIACISIVALLITAQMPVNAFWWKVVERGAIVVTAFCYVGDRIVGEINYTESCYVESTGLWYYGYYKNIHFWKKQISKYSPATDTTSYWSYSLHGDIQVLDDNDSFPLKPSRQSKFCDYSTTDENGKIWKTQYNTLEKFRFAVKNTVVSERGALPFLYAGPFTTRVLWHVTPLFKDCSTSESVYPVTDYLDLQIPKHGTIGGLEGNLVNREYTDSYFKRPANL